MVAMAVLIVAMTVAGHLDAAAGSQGPLVADVARSSCRTPSVQQRWIQLLRRAPFFRRPAVAAALAAAFPSGASARPPSFRASFAAAAAAAAAAEGVVVAAAAVVVVVVAAAAPAAAQAVVDLWSARLGVQQLLPERR